MRYLCFKIICNAFSVTWKGNCKDKGSQVHYETIQDSLIDLRQFSIFLPNLTSSDHDFAIFEKLMRAVLCRNLLD